MFALFVLCVQYEQVTALAQADRHEAALVSNVIVPRDIGVTWSMIGGLKQAKELLRQSITYPLRFPHLYSEGIAQEVSHIEGCNSEALLLATWSTWATLTDSLKLNNDHKG